MKAAIIAFLILIISGCKTIERIEYVDRYHNTTSTDTLIRYDKDSIFVKEYLKGDTVFLVKHIEKIKYRDRVSIITDTVKVVDIQQVTEIKEVVPSWCYKLISILTLLLAIFSIYFFVIKKR